MSPLENSAQAHVLRFAELATATSGKLLLTAGVVTALGSACACLGSGLRLIAGGAQPALPA
jgi:hypothetical protein